MDFTKHIFIDKIENAAAVEVLLIQIAPSVQLFARCKCTFVVSRGESTIRTSNNF